MSTCRSPPSRNVTSICTSAFRFIFSARRFANVAFPSRRTFVAVAVGVELRDRRAIAARLIRPCVSYMASLCSSLACPACNVVHVQASLCASQPSSSDGTRRFKRPLIGYEGRRECLAGGCGSAAQFINRDTYVRWTCELTSLSFGARGGTAFSDPLALAYMAGHRPASPPSPRPRIGPGDLSGPPLPSPPADRAPATRRAEREPKSNFPILRGKRRQLRHFKAADSNFADFQSGR